MCNNKCDAGSLTLGYVIAYLVIKNQMPDWSALDGDKLPLLLSYSLVIIPVFDLIRVALMRMKNGKAIFSPDKTHIHHIMMNAGVSMRKTLIYLLALFWIFNLLNMLLGCLGVNITSIVMLNVIMYVGFVLYCERLDRPKIIEK